MSFNQKKNFAHEFPAFIKNFPLALMPSGIPGPPVLDAEAGQVVFHTIDAPSTVPSHSHDDSWAILVRGNMEVFIGKDKFVVGPGESWFIPAGVNHGGNAIDDCLLIEVFCEKRFPLSVTTDSTEIV